MADTNPFGDLTGIEAPRDVTKREPTTLERLLDMEEDIVKMFWGEIEKNRDYYYFEEGNKVYKKIIEEVRRRCKGITFDAETLTDYVQARMNKEHKGEHEDHLRGMYSGVLLHILTIENRKQGERTLVRVDGNGGRFDYLFYFARHVDDIVVKNIVGYNILGKVASGYGTAKRIVLANCPDVTSPLNEVAEYHGAVDLVYCSDIKGNPSHPTNIAGEKGRVKYLILERVKEMDIGGSTDSGMVNDEEGGVSNLILKDVELLPEQLGFSVKKCSVIPSSKDEEPPGITWNTLLTSEKAVREYERVMKKYGVRELLEGTR